MKQQRLSDSNLRRENGGKFSLKEIKQLFLT